MVPYFGPIAASMPPILFALADSPEKALLVAIVFIVVQQIEGNITIPLVMSQTVRLHPAVIAVGVVIVGQLLGFIGLFVAVPLHVAVRDLVEEIWVKRAAGRDGDRARRAGRAAAAGARKASEAGYVTGVPPSRVREASARAVDSVESEAARKARGSGSL